MLGVLGGNFDPVHIGHLRLALELYQDLPFREVRLIPCGSPPHRSPPQASAEQRLTMLRQALQGEPGIYVDDRETKRPGPSYTVDTLEALQVELSGTPICLIMGTDAFLSLPTWHHWHKLLSLAHLVVAHRPYWSEREIPSPLAELLTEYRTSDPSVLAGQHAGYILFHEVTALGISSSNIRRSISQGKSARYLVPDSVWKLIQSQCIYSQQSKG